MNTCHKKAYAKINLGLDVVGRLPNGYHEVKMIMQTVDIFDELTLERAESGITVTADTGELPTDENNLIYKAAKLMMGEFPIEGGVRIYLRKNIPIAAGMAGGSTDAAAAMKGMNELFGLGASGEELMKLGVRIGADVPYCIMGGTALAEGIGEKLTALSSPPDCLLVVAKPEISVSTKYVYEHLDAADYSHPDIDGMVGAIEEGSLNGIVRRLENVLESVTAEEYPVVTAIKKVMTESGALGSLMSGSGPTVFGIFDNLQMAESAVHRIGKEERLAKQVFLTRFVNRGEICTEQQGEAL